MPFDLLLIVYFISDSILVIIYSSIDYVFLSSVISSSFYHEDKWRVEHSRLRNLLKVTTSKCQN